MKLLVLSNVSGGVDKVVDLLQQRNSVVAKESSVPNDALVQTVANELTKGTYDAVIVIARDPIGAGMLLNKQEGVEAAVCGSAEDVGMAQDNGANVIVIRDVRSDNLPDMLGELAGSAGVLKGIRVPKIEIRAPSRAKQSEKVRKDYAGGSQKGSRGREADDEPNTEDERRLASIAGTRKGIIGKLKDSLGIL